MTESQSGRLRDSVMGQDWVIRRAVVADAANLSHLAEKTFRDAFSALNTAENMDRHCAAAYSPAVLATEVDDPAIQTVLVEAQGRLVAYAQLNLRPNPPGCVPVAASVEIRRIYVDQSFHGAGLARDLMSHLIEAAEEHGAAALWLGVWEHNPRAIRFYRRLGFSEVGHHVFVVGADPQRDIVMVRSLVQVPA